MRRVVLVLAAALVAVLLFPTTASAGLDEGPQVWFVNGIGNDPGDNPFDVYFRLPDDGTFSLLIQGADDFAFGDTYDTGNSGFTGEVQILVCEAAAAPNPTINDCSDNGTAAVNGNSGNTVVLEDVAQMTLFVGYGSIGRPEVLPFVPNEECVETPETGRLTVFHAADANPIDVLLDETVELADIANSAYESTDQPENPYHLEITDGALLDIDVLGFLIDGGVERVLFVTGDPDDDTNYNFIPQDFDGLPVCEQPIITTSSTASTTTQAEPRVQPRFTG